MTELMQYILNFRVVSIMGYMGWGKTGLAFLIAKYMLEHGHVDGVISNVPTILPPHISRDDGTLNNRVLIFDEAGMLGLDSRTSMSNTNGYGAFARKFGCFFILPTVIPPDKRVRTLEINPFTRNAFTDTRTYEYSMPSDRTKNPLKGYFKVKPKSWYGLYSTGYIPIDDCGILERFQISHALKTGSLYDDSETDERAATAESLNVLAAVE